MQWVAWILFGGAGVAYLALIVAAVLFGHRGVR